MVFFWLHRAACRMLVPRPGIEPGPRAVKVPSPNHWTTKEFPYLTFFAIKFHEVRDIWPFYSMLCVPRQSLAHGWRTINMCEWMNEWSPLTHQNCEGFEMLSLPQFHGCWQRTRDMQVRDKGLCHSQHSREQSFMFASVSVAPQVPGRRHRAVLVDISGFGAWLRHPDFREPRSVIMGTNTPALSLPRGWHYLYHVRQ